MVRTTMPSSTSRHPARKGQRRGPDHDGDGFGEDDTNAANDQNRGKPRVEELRASFASMHSRDSDDFDEKKPPPKPPRRLSSSLMDALEDSNSELAHFLLSRNDEDDHGLFGSNSMFDNSFMKSVRNMTTRFVTGEDEVHEVGSLRTNKAWFYSLALEPMEVRRDRIIMLAEAYAIFGALFLSGTWVLYEWGSGYGYGGCTWEDTSYCHPAVDRAFEVVMAMAITANVFQAMFSSFLWLMSIMFSGSHRNWVYGAINFLVLCHLLLVAVFVLMILGVGLGIYAKLAPYWPELAIAMTFLLTVVIYGIYTTAHLAAEEISLEYYHFPLWFKWAIFPYPMLRRGGRQRIREAAETRAKELKARAYKERTMINPNASITTVRRTAQSMSSVGMLLRRAADRVGRREFDVSTYEERLEEDWYSDAEELRSMSIETLSRYMPRRLAQEVHSQLASETDGRSGRSIGSGVLLDEGPQDKRVSWNMEEDSD